MSAEQNIIPGTMTSLPKFITGGGGRLFGKLNMAASNNSTNAAYLSALRSSFYRIIHLIDDCSRDAAALEYALFRVDVLYQAMQRFNLLPSGRDAILDRLNNVRQILVAAIDVDEASDQEGYLTDCQISLHKGQTGNFVMRTEDLPCALQIPGAQMKI